MRQKLKFDMELVGFRDAGAPELGLHRGLEAL